MDELFRFQAIRPPRTADQTAAVDITLPNSVLQRQLSAIKTTGSLRRQQLVRDARAFLAQPGNAPLLTQAAPLTSAVQLDALVEAIREGKAVKNLGTLRTAIKKQFGSDPEKVVVKQPFVSDQQRVYDSIVLSVLLPDVQKQVPNQLFDWAHAMSLMGRAAQNDAALDVSNAILAALNGVVLLPPQIFPPQPDRIKPVGWSDLLVVRQNLKRYSLGEISHIENILQGESKGHTLVHTLKTDQFTSTETEVTKEELKDLQTTDRFELKRASETVQKEDTSVKAGVSLSAKYGDTLQVKVDTSVAYDNAKSETEQQAADYSHDVVSRATKKVTERVLTQNQQRVTEEFDETDKHDFNNEMGPSNVVGVYQWVNKIYEAQIFNYGWRLLFDITVPEPAAMLLDAATHAPNLDPPVKPDDFDLQPVQISEDPQNQKFYYEVFIAKYGVPGVEPPPASFVTVSQAKSDKTDKTDANDQIVGDLSIKIPDGYVALDGWATGEFNFKNNDPAKGVRITVGNATVLINQQAGQTIPFAFALGAAPLAPSGIYDPLPVGIETKDVKDYEFTIVVRCARTAEKFWAWQLKTHAAIEQAYTARLGEYKTAMKAQQFNAAPQAALGGSEQLNRKIERTELKRGCIGSLAAVNVFDMNIDDVVEKPPNPPAQAQTFSRPDLIKTPQDAILIRFFEQAFEWENMSYFFYPYYWGRSSTWYNKALANHPDAMFADFLNAGSARVVVPVRPGFQDDVLYYVANGQPWQGGPAPSVTDSDYLPIAQEIKASQGAPGSEVPVGDPWEVVLPTTLVKLRSDGKLPEWMKVPDPNDPNGVRMLWVPAIRDAKGKLSPDPNPQ